MVGMEAMKHSGCGSTNVEFDPKRRVLICHQCGKEEYYSRATLNKNQKIAYGRRNAIQFFQNAKYDDSRHYAREVMDIFLDNAPAMFIMAYYDEFIAGKPDSMKRFFQEIKEVPLEYEEVKELRDLLLASARNLADYEEMIIEVIALNMQSEEDAQELNNFIDKICHYFISKRTSARFLTENLIEMYRDLAEHCGIPKTCLELIRGIETNPDSPYVNNSFYLRAKSRYFYENYITNIESILAAMKDETLKRKFLAAYQKKREQYKKDAGIA